MTGPLAQIVSLTAFGNDFLYSGRLPENYINNLSFQFCNQVDFRIFKQPFFFMKKKEVKVANNPSEWFAWLKNNGCRKLRLFFQSSQDQSLAKDYKLAGLVGGGGTWLIEAIYDGYSNGWESRWEVTQKDDPQQNIWSVNYGITLKHFTSIDLQIQQQQCKDDLNKTLAEIEAFAFQHDLGYWGDQFKDARETLFSESPENSYYYKELVPLDRLSLIAKQILFSAGKAWVFGAMGSWNDLGFDTKEDNDRYESLTEMLYERVNRAIVSAVNSY